MEGDGTRWAPKGPVPLECLLQLLMELMGESDGRSDCVGAGRVAGPKPVNSVMLQSFDMFHQGLSHNSLIQRLLIHTGEMTLKRMISETDENQKV